jgi:hypothetical protein
MVQLRVSFNPCPETAMFKNRARALGGRIIIAGEHQPKATPTGAQQFARAQLGDAAKQRLDFRRIGAGIQLWVKIPA